MPLIEVKVPVVGESISTGILATWHVADGATVAKDQPLYELETDKITSEGLAEAAGNISIKVPAGTEVKIGQVVGTIDTDAATGAQTAQTVGQTGGLAARPPVGPTISPAVRRISEETGIDPAAVSGTGKDGRVTKGDMIAAPAKAAVAETVGQTGGLAARPPVGPTTEPAAPAGRQTRRKMSPLRKRIAERLVAAQHEAAMLTTFAEVDMSAVVALRAQHQEAFVKANGVKLGFMSFFTKAVVHALKEVPSVNAQIDGGAIVENHFYDIGIAVSTEKGLMVPVIRDCDRLGMAEIEKAIAGAAQKARDGKIAIADLEGGVFTITNGGIFGSMLSTPIINPPQSAILGLHTIKDRPVAIDGQVFVRPIMYLALSYDHRLIDGREAVTFLVKVKEVIENPSLLPLGL